MKNQISTILKRILIVIILIVICILLISGRYPDISAKVVDKNAKINYVKSDRSFKESPPVELSFLISQPRIEEIEKNEKEKYDERLNRSMTFLEVPVDKRKMIAHAVKLATRETGISSNMILALMKTESEFNERAVSPKRYKGLMQTPFASFDYPDVDTLYGARILQDKMVEAKGNTLLALSLYKGGKNKVARKYAKETLTLYNELEKLTK